MSSLVELRLKEIEIIQDIYKKYGGEVPENEAEELDKLQSAIADKVDAYATVLKTNIKEEISKVKEAKKELDKVIKHLEDEEEKIQLRLHNLSKESPLVGERYQIKPDISVTRTVDMELVDDKDVKYVLPVISYPHFEILCRAIANFPAKDEDEEDRLTWLSSRFEVVDTKCNVTDLPPDHPAIIKHIRPTVKILKA